MKKLDNADKMIVASVILAIGIVISAHFIANPKSELEQCIEGWLSVSSNPSSPSVQSYARKDCLKMIAGN